MHPGQKPLRLGRARLRASDCRPLAWRQRIGMLLGKLEQRAAIVQREGVIVHRNPGPETQINALDQRHDIALCIHCRKINGVARRRQRITGFLVAPRPIGLDQRGAFTRICFRQETRDRDAREARIGSLVSEWLERDRREFARLFGQFKRALQALAPPTD